MSWASIIGAIMVVIASGLIWESFNEDYVSAFASAFATSGQGLMFYPRILLGVMLALALAVTAQGFTEKFVKPGLTQLLLPVGSIILVGVYIWAIGSLGFLLSSIFFLTFFSLLWGYRRFVMLTSIGIIFPVGVWYLFEEVFLIVLPASPWDLPF